MSGVAAKHHVPQSTRKALEIKEKIDFYGSYAELCFGEKKNYDSAALTS
jgi:hypothetical protein